MCCFWMLIDMHKTKRFRDGKRKRGNDPYFKPDFLEDPWISMMEARIGQGLASSQEWQLFAPRHPSSAFFQPSFVENPWKELERKHGIEPTTF